MFLRVTVCSLMAVGFLLAQYTEAGSSFLSPADLHKPQPRKPARKIIPNNPQRRELDGVFDVYEKQPGDEEREIRFNVPFEIGVKMSATQYLDYGQLLQEILQGLFPDNTPGPPGENE
uniref:Ghrelin n=1 Tax=Cynops ensicauda TaxID=102207 RepID=I7GSQ7_9SALA|nr:ghrelin [Cynops ensicauda]